MHFKEVKSILMARNGMNIYRGCSHGCIYCDSRSHCYQFKHPFEDIEVKSNAPELLESALLRKRNKCMIGTGSMCDPYMHIEREVRYTRRCLEIIERHGFGVAVLTKSAAVLDDLELLKRINERSKCVVQMTLTTYDEELCRIIEPDVSTTKERFEALKVLRDNGIPTVVWLTPFLPFINDTEENLRGLLDYCAQANVYGIINFGISLTLRDGNREYFYEKLDRHFPGLKQKYQKKYGRDYVLMSDKNHELVSVLNTVCLSKGILCDNNAVFSFMNTYEDKQQFEQISFF